MKKNFQKTVSISIQKKSYSVPVSRIIELEAESFMDNILNGSDVNNVDTENDPYGGSKSHYSDFEDEEQVIEI